jgi:hypothetical protein
MKDILVKVPLSSSLTFSLLCNFLFLSSPKSDLNTTTPFSIAGADHRERQKTDRNGDMVVVRTATMDGGGKVGNGGQWRS